jgi:hypothetical protein
VSAFADAVVALDDGSTDETARTLAAHPLVKVLLANPRRESHLGWDDSANRNRLLAAAAELDPDWIVSLDADERIPADDAVALRVFLEDEASAGHAYAFGVHRMIGDTDHYDRFEFFALRAFAYEPGQRFASDRLHFAPIPTSIPEGKWVPTSIRIQHLAGLGEARRQARWSKYQEVDPEQRWEPDYSYTLRPTGEVRAWPVRREGQPVVLSGDEFGALLVDAAELHAPALSIVVLLGDQGDLEAVDLPSTGAEVLALAGPEAAARVRKGHPGQAVIELEAGTEPVAARNLALRLARGDHLLFLEPGDALSADGLDAIVAAHDEGHAMVGGTVVNEERSVVGWASYLLDHAASLPGGSGPTPAMPPTACCYARTPLVLLDGFPERAPSVVNHVLARWGFSSTRVGGLTFASRAPGPVSFLRERFSFGRTLVRSLAAEPPVPWTPSPAAGLARYAPDRLRAVGQALTTDARLLWATVPAVPFVLAGVTATLLGAGVERALGLLGR